MMRSLNSGGRGEESGRRNRGGIGRLVPYSTSNTSDDLIVLGDGTGAGEAQNSRGDVGNQIPTSPEVIVLSDDSDDDDIFIYEPTVVDENLVRLSPLRQPKRGAPSGDQVIRDETHVSRNKVRMGITRGRGSLNLYTPLQRWEFEHGLPVDGVTNVRTWAIEVGLAEEESEGTAPQKKRRCAGLIDIPKYEQSSTVFEFGEASDVKDTTPEAVIDQNVTGERTAVEESSTEKKEDFEVASVCKGKGKKPLKEQ
ncbi:hypothetical protein KC19_VG028200 [Ceratodon purpureus]|uniref:Uncharacterized protein n=1 Tax=Ceratodon purpureus TaxID=3225 RepID=A0A8T0HLL3_CERPU|nr:hypothetical protein KC19_VG028200 [Ceratodon purpureus]